MAAPDGVQPTSTVIAASDRTRSLPVCLSAGLTAVAPESRLVDGQREGRMTIQYHHGLIAIDKGRFWKTVHDVDGWRIQYSQTRDKKKRLDPFRLLDPHSNLWFTCNSEAELLAAMPALIEQCRGVKPRLSFDDLKAGLAKLGIAVIQAVKAKVTAKVK